MVRPRLVALDDRVTPASIGGLDLTFNQTGLVDVQFDLGGTKADLGADIAIQRDGKILVVGSVQNGPSDVDFAIARLNPDGSLDPTFGSNGLRAIGFDLGGGNVDRATSIAIQNDGKIVVAGFSQVDATTDFDFAILRLTADGDLDATFDGDGRQTVAFDIPGGTNEDKAADVAIDSLGRIVVVGSVAMAAAGDFDFGASRLLSDGSLDAGFDGDGREEVAFDLGGGNADFAVAVAIDGQNRVLIGGTVQISNFGDTDFGVTRLTAAGILDTTYAGDGTATVEFDLGGSNADTTNDIALDFQGRVVIVGTVAADSTGDLDVGIARLSTDGTLDTTLDTDGKLALGFDVGGGKQDRAGGVAVDRATGQIVVSATVDTSTAGDTDFALARFFSDGSLDPTFDGDGRSVVPFDRGGANADTAAKIALDASGRILAVGSLDTTVAADRDIGVARVIGRTGQVRQLVIGGQANGTADVFVGNSTGFTASGSISQRPSNTATTRPAVADLNGDGILDTILGAGPGGGSRVVILLGEDRTLSGSTVTELSFDAFEGNFNGGVFVAAGDVDGDGRAEFTVSPDVGGGPRASVYSVDVNNQLAKRADFFGIDDPNFRGGARVAMGDIDGDGRADLVVGAGFLGGPRVAVFDGATLIGSANPPKLVNDFFAFPGQDSVTLRNGVFVTVGDLNGDGLADLIFGGGPGGGPRVYALDGQRLLTGSLDSVYANPVANFFVANDSQSRGGVRLAVKDIDNDDRVDLITGSGDGIQPGRVRVYAGSSIATTAGEPTLLQEFSANVGTNGVFVG